MRVFGKRRTSFATPHDVCRAIASIGRALRYGDMATASLKLFFRIERNSSTVCVATFSTHAPAWRTILPDNLKEMDRHVNELEAQRRDHLQ